MRAKLREASPWLIPCPCGACQGVGVGVGSGSQMRDPVGLRSGAELIRSRPHFPVTQHRQGPAPDHFQHLDNSENLCGSAAATATVTCRALKPPEKPLWPAAALGRSSYPKTVLGLGRDGAGHPPGPTAISTALAGGFCWRSCWICPRD